MESNNKPQKKDFIQVDNSFIIMCKGKPIDCVNVRTEEFRQYEIIADYMNKHHNRIDLQYDEIEVKSFGDFKGKTDL